MAPQASVHVCPFSVLGSFGGCTPRRPRCAKEDKNIPYPHIFHAQAGLKYSLSGFLLFIRRRILFYQALNSILLGAGFYLIRR